MHSQAAIEEDYDATLAVEDVDATLAVPPEDVEATLVATPERPVLLASAAQNLKGTATGVQCPPPKNTGLGSKRRF